MLAEQRERQQVPRSSTWHGPTTTTARKPTWVAPTISIEIEFPDYDTESEFSDEEDYEDVEMDYSYVYRSPALEEHAAARDYFSVPRTTLVGEEEEEEEYYDDDLTATPPTELFTEEPIAADIPEAEFESSRRRSIEIERQPLFLETKDDEVMVEDIMKHLADPSLDPIAPATAPVVVEEPKDVTVPVKVEEAKVDTSEPPMPDDIIERARTGSVGRKGPRINARDRFRKAGRMLFTVGVLGRIPPAPLPDELIPDEPRPRSKPKKQIPAAPPAPVSPPPVVVVPKIVEPVIVEPVIVEPPKAQTLVFKDTIPLQGVTIEVTPAPAKPISSHSSMEGGVALGHTPSPAPISQQHLFPPLPHSMARSDEGYLSGESDTESDDGNFGVPLTTPIDDDDGEAPLPEDIMAGDRSLPRENERYQHHCMLHGHFFPKSGPLRSEGYPDIPFIPWVQCHRCNQDALKEYWQCSLLNQCGTIVCSPCHDELVRGLRPKQRPDAFARVQEVARAGKAERTMVRAEREAQRKQRRQSEAPFAGSHRSWETETSQPRAVKKQRSLDF
jgi:hypothetical protein